MINALKTSAILTACLVLASACSPDGTSQFNALAVDSDPSNQIAATVEAPKASPVNLALLDRLATEAGTKETNFAQSLPISDTSDATERTFAIPAATATYETQAPVLLDSEADYNSESLIVVPHDSDLLEGTVHDKGADRTLRKPVMTPGRYRTIEYKS